MARRERILSLKVTTAVNAACVTTLAALLCGCTQNAAAKQDGDVIANVNGAKITRGDLEADIQAVGADTATAVESLINEELLVQNALASHLDRDPMVVQEVERARRQILARTYEERSVLPHTEISMSAKREYYRNNPALFARRRIYRTLTFSIARADMTPTLRNALDHARSAIHVRELLDRRHIPFEAVEITRPAQEIPMDILPQLAQAAIGDVLIAPALQQAHTLLICVVGAQDSPVDFEHASASIGQYLTDIRKQEAVAQYLRRARSLASISYRGSGSGDAAPLASASESATRKAASLE
jgi:EpsD family peptidyl-prolyl cis-trans isomerase